MSGDQQQIAGGDDLFLGELIAGLLDRDQARHQILAGVRAAPLDEIAQVPAQPQAGLHPFLEAIGRLAGERNEGVQRLRQQRRRPAELRLVLDRHTEQAADHRDRQRVGEVGDHVEPALLGDLVEQRINQRRDAGFQRLHHLRGERLADQSAKPGVIRRVEKQESRCAQRTR